MNYELSKEFCQIAPEEGMLIDGGKSKAIKFLQAFTGTVIVATTPIVGVGAGIVGTPLGGLAAAGSYCGLGLTLIGSSTH
jgi:hypothetical protein